MHWISWTGWVAAAAMMGIDQAAAQGSSSPVTDVDTGFVFAAYSGRYDTSNGAIQFRVAVPSGVGTNEPYDAVLQVVAPTAVGWAGVAWGGSMTYNPLTVVWPSGQTVTLSSRWATCVVAPVLVAFFGSGNKLLYCIMFISLTPKPERAMPQNKSAHAAPAPYTVPVYEVLKTGTRVNSTHWQITAKCSGCTSFQGRAGAAPTWLRPTGSNRLAFAMARTAPSQPASNTSAIPYHEVHQYWNADFGSAQNENFGELVQRNL
ncbi:hypothetical protein MCOR27_009032 [Pyricularia oryzae]|uniref:Cellobiose dehydrogenase-like cytochrome domain-containing protein n=1 Tax=Pyricularia oryzae TaxID=318829 RepID=A0A4P7NS36_PYROR|nr:hypothetical protein MCOR02_006699 [Pyricularia oryzae]KAI6267831.1 hypothetical protein MCOR26_009511 [Pyricularia oryzae]KAI6271006.1 hypothetical protein MCOR27_009032 [Pyricularia oryzae]KAI6325269.1 hypothetical protein MCOR30_006807 [Pyricularia oryzae]KAI6338915.1 hypothetical protein MCOR28_007580 [Pyricularia oryzae]